MNETSFYGNIYQVDTSGASELTAKINNLTRRGLPHSNMIPFVASLCGVFYQLDMTHYRERGIFWAGWKQPYGHVKVQRQYQESWKEVCLSVTSSYYFSVLCGCLCLEVVADMFVVMRPNRHCPLHSLKIHPALIAGIISRQSCAGTKINSSGYGVNDTNCYGLMQVCVCSCRTWASSSCCTVLHCIKAVHTTLLIECIFFFLSRCRLIRLMMLLKEMPSARSTWTRAPPSWFSSSRPCSEPILSGQKSSSWRVKLCHFAAHTERHCSPSSPPPPAALFTCHY